MRNKGGRLSIIGTQKDNIELHAFIMELRFGHAMGNKAIARFLCMDVSNVSHIISKYYPRKGRKDMIVTIMSEV